MQIPIFYRFNKSKFVGYVNITDAEFEKFMIEKLKGDAKHVHIYCASLDPELIITFGIETFHKT